ncbi:MAG TPA: acyl-CoA dehydrogenase family protein [Micromonosporaceae bacterium]
MSRALTPQRVPAIAARIADDVLFPAALDVDRADRLPVAHLDLLAAEGLYGVAAPPEAGGLGVQRMDVAADLVQTLASGCLATTFVLIQHHGCVIAATFSQQPGVRERWLQPLAHGTVRGGIALAGVRGGPNQVRVRRTERGFVLDGDIPWVTGWDMIDVVHVGAVDEDANVHFLLVDAAESPTLRVTPLDLAAVRASRTVTMHLAGHEVPADRLTGTRPYGEWERAEAGGSALNGFLALGVVERCARLLGGPDWLQRELTACRCDLLAAVSAEEPTATAPARAAASELALRAAAALSVHTGSRSVLRSEHAERLLREAAFLLVFGSRPAIREALLERLVRQR